LGRGHKEKFRLSNPGVIVSADCACICLQVNTL